MWDSFIPSMNLLGTKLLELCCVSDEASHGGDENLVLLVVSERLCNFDQLYVFFVGCFCGTVSQFLLTLGNRNYSLTQEKKFF